MTKIHVDIVVPIVPCLYCGHYTNNANFICSDECFEEYANANVDLYDADLYDENPLAEIEEMASRGECSYGQWEDSDDGRYDE